MSLASMIALMVRPLARLNAGIGLVGRAAAGALLLVMTATILVQIVSRYVFNDAISWSEELSKTLMVWIAFLVAPWAYRHGANVRIDLFIDAVPFRIQALIRISITLLTLWILVIFFGESLAFIERGMKSLASTLPVRTGIFYVVVPLSLFAIFLAAWETLLREIAELASGKPDPDSPAQISRREA